MSTLYSSRRPSGRGLCLLDNLPENVGSKIFKYLLPARQAPRQLELQGTSVSFEDTGLGVEPFFLLFDLLPRVSAKETNILLESLRVKCLPRLGHEAIEDGKEALLHLFEHIGPENFTKIRNLTIGIQSSTWMAFNDPDGVIAYLKFIASLPPARQLRDLPLKITHTGHRSIYYVARFLISGFIGLHLDFVITAERKRKRPALPEEQAADFKQVMHEQNRIFEAQTASAAKLDYTKLFPSELRQQIIQEFVPVHCADDIIHDNFQHLQGRELLSVNRITRKDYMELMRSRCVFQLSCDRHLHRLREFFETANYKRLKLLYIGLKKLGKVGDDEFFESDMKWLKDLIRNSSWGGNLKMARREIRPILLNSKVGPGLDTNEYLFKISGLRPNSVVVIKVFAHSRPWLEWGFQFRRTVLIAHLSNMIGKACDSLAAEASGEVIPPGKDHEMLEKMFSRRSIAPGGPRIIGDSDDEGGQENDVTNTPKRVDSPLANIG
jgi:hypothetical protein